MKNKIIWPIGITLSIAFVIAFLMWFLFFSLNEMDSLVSDNYYEQAINYQETISRLENTTERDRFLVISEGDTLIITSQYSDIKGTILLTKPDNQRMDISKPLQLNSKNQQKIILSKGVWNYSIIWSRGAKEYQQKGKVYFQ
jgi:hypothetical protein